VTAYQRPPQLHETLFILISQSGRSPDLVNATEVARKCGALTLAILNEVDSPAAGVSELTLPIGAGSEQSVAATKTVVLSMLAGAQLVAAMARGDELNDGLKPSDKPERCMARTGSFGHGDFLGHPFSLSQAGSG
jgi:glucosamine--fructose-6-phosphate aminotransferase (isomerizing)